MELPGLSSIDRKASSETLGVVVLVGMTVLVTAGLGIGVLVMGQQQQEQTATVDFTFLGDQMVVIYDDSTDRQAENLYIDGPNGNASWVELADNKSAGDMVTKKDTVRIGPDTPYNAKADQDARYDLVYFTESGERYVLASVNADAGTSDQSSEPPSPGG
jgi:hypothetical protein